MFVSMTRVTIGLAHWSDFENRTESDSFIKAHKAPCEWFGALVMLAFLGNRKSAQL